MNERLCILMLCGYSVLGFNDSYGMVSLSSSESSKLYNQVIRKNFADCKMQIKQLHNFAKSQEMVYWTRLQQQMNDDDYCSWSHYSFLSGFWTDLLEYLDKKTDGSELLKKSASLGVRVQKAVRTLFPAESQNLSTSSVKNTSDTEE